MPEGLGEKGHLRENLRIVEKRWPHIARMVRSAADLEGMALTPARDGEMTLVLPKEGREHLLHSRYAPRKEAEAFLEDQNVTGADVIVCLGLGLGYHIESLLARRSQDCQIVLVEKEAAILRAFLNRRDWRFLLEAAYVHLVCGAVSFMDIVRLSSEWLSPKSYTRREWVFLSWPPSMRRDREYYVQTAAYFRDAAEKARLDLGTKVMMVPLFPQNISRNLAWVMQSTPVRELAGTGRGRPFVVVGSGPSLNEATAYLKRLEGRAIIASAGSAYRVLLKEGIEPDFVVAIDARALNAKHFEGVAASRSALVYSPIVAPGVVEGPFSRRFVCTCGGSEDNVLLSLLEEVFGELGRLPTACSVTTTCFSLGHLLGASPIIFVGQDCGYLHGRTHADGNILSRQMEDDPKSLQFVESNSGGKVATNAGWIAILRALEMCIASTGVECVNTSRDGAKIAGAPYRPLSEICRELQKSAQGGKQHEQEFHALAASQERVDQFGERLEQAVEEVEAYRQEAEKMREQAADLLRVHLLGQRGPVHAQLTALVQRGVEEVRAHACFEWIKPWMYEAMQFIEKSSVQKPTGVDRQAWEINRAGVLFQAVEMATEQALDCLRTARRRVADSIEPVALHA